MAAGSFKMAAGSFKMAAGSFKIPLKNCLSCGKLWKIKYKQKPLYGLRRIYNGSVQAGIY